MIVARDDLVIDEAAAMRRVVVLQEPECGQRGRECRIAHELPDLHLWKQSTRGGTVHPFLVRRGGLWLAVGYDWCIHHKVRALINDVRNVLGRHVPEGWDARCGVQDVFNDIQVPRGQVSVREVTREPAGHLGDSDVHWKGFV